MGTKLGFGKSRKHFLQQVKDVDKNGKPVENTYICLTCEKEREKKD